MTTPPVPVSPSGPPSPPASDGVVMRTGVAQCAIGYTLAGLGACLVVLAGQLGLVQADIAWFSSTFGAGLLAVGACGPWLLRAAVGVVLRVTCAVMAVGAVGLATGPSLPAAAAGSLLLGVGAAGVVLVTPALLSGPKVAGHLSLVNGVASASGIAAPAVVAAIQGAGASGRLALLVPVPLLVWVAARRTLRLPEPRVEQATRPPRGRVVLGWVRMVLAISAEFCFVIWAVARLQDAGASLEVAALLGMAFPVGMAAGRLLGPMALGRIPLLPIGAVVAMVGAVVVACPVAPWVVAVGLVAAGGGIAVCYPLTLADLVGVPGLAPRYSASLGALASGTAVLLAPAALAVAADAVGLRWAFLLAVPLLAVLVALPPVQGRRRRAAGAPRPA